MIPEHIKNLDPFMVMEVLEEAQKLESKGKHIVHLEVGEPDFDVPKIIKQKAIKAINDNNTKYTHSLGLYQLRETICKYYCKKYKVSIQPDQVIVTSGTSPAILLVLSVLLQNNDEVILSDPGYACYPNFIQFCHGVPIRVKVDADDGFQYRAETIQKHLSPKTRAILINSPMNPTGNILSASRMKDIADLGIPIISDEIYHGLVYEGTEHSIIEFTDDAFVLNGFSKLFAMTGLRVGYIIAPKKYVRHIQILQQNLFISANSVFQHAVVNAFEDCENDIQKMKIQYNKNRKYCIKRLRELGFTIHVEPQGAFYVFANARHISNNSLQLAFDILKKAHVGVTPGIDFGPNGEGYLRFSYANSMENIVEGLNRIEKYINKNVFHTSSFTRASS